jgi:heterodisulfide reductase subunit A-like polyferredoxin
MISSTPPPEVGYHLWRCDYRFGIRKASMLPVRPAGIILSGQRPRDVVFIQCVGSHDKTVAMNVVLSLLYVHTKKSPPGAEKLPDANITVFYMDEGFEGI